MQWSSGAKHSGELPSPLARLEPPRLSLRHRHRQVPERRPHQGPPDVPHPGIEERGIKLLFSLFVQAGHRGRVRLSVDQPRIHRVF